MHFIKFRWKSWLLLFTALVLMTAFVTGCADKQVNEKPTIKIIDTQFESLWINNAIAKIIIEKGYNYPVEIIQMTSPVYMLSLPKGDVHLHMEMWQQNTIDWYNKQIAAGTIENLGMTYEGGPQFFIIPKWMAEEYNIKTIFDMKNYWELVKDPEDSTKGIFFNSIIGWQCTVINEIKLEAYGLTDYYNIVSPGSSGAMDASLIGPQKQHRPVFGYYWSPTSLMGAYDWYVLEEPEYDPAVWETIEAAVADKTLRPLSEACAYDNLPVEKGVWSGLRNMAPDVVAMLEKMVVGLDPLNVTAAWTVENEIQDYDQSAIYYLKNYEGRWKTWVTDDAYNKIKDALKGL